MLPVNGKFHIKFQSAVSSIYLRAFVESGGGEDTGAGWGRTEVPLSRERSSLTESTWDLEGRQGMGALPGTSQGEQEAGLFSTQLRKCLPGTVTLQIGYLEE